ncbi:MAG: hypothetical protein ACRECO_02225 [Xanthobacteraceae bacterium]
MPDFGKLAVAVAIVTSCSLAGCIPGETGYVEIKTVPVSARATPSFYLDQVKLDPIRKGVAVLKQRAGTAKLASDAGGHLTVLCEIVVRKDRITSVTVSVLERPPRCHCRNSDGKKRVCLS